MKNNSKSQWFSQNFWMLDIIFCITNKNKAPKLEKKEKRIQPPLNKNYRPVTQQCLMQPIKLLKWLIVAGEFRKHCGGHVIYLLLPPNFNWRFSELL